MIVTGYEREFVWLSKYTWEYVSTEEIMCKRFVDGLNEDIKLLVGILELKEFVVLVDRACKVEELNSFNHPSVSIGYSNKDRGKQFSSPKAQVTLESSVGNVKNNKT
ncbi:Gag-Pol polyprotein [Gossypium australe]|uniref:Gag-Pol polyprotein n=1 Tax=Gossypium australe TaxID=47621 RepID=A0A5B6X3D6_9ROSI|nr:Gag-Pol polyprotein [Gossypium australe]